MLGALVDAGILAAPFYADNFAQLTAATAPWFDVPWVYEATFAWPPPGVPESAMATLLFKGLNYRADVVLNGSPVGSAVGTFRYFAYNVSGLLAASNTLQVTVTRPHDECFPPDNNSTDLANTFVDWAPAPPDENMGIWREVEVLATGAVRLSSAAVVTSDLDEAKGEACLTVMVDLDAVTDAQSVILLVDIAELAARAILYIGAMAAGTHSTVSVNCTENVSLRVAGASLWWPRQWGSPRLYTASLVVAVDAGMIPSDNATVAFGIRTVTSELDGNGHRLYRVNGRPFLVCPFCSVFIFILFYFQRCWGKIVDRLGPDAPFFFTSCFVFAFFWWFCLGQVRGAGWSPDLFLRDNATSLRAQMELMVDLGINTVRLEGKMPPDVFFDLCDQFGIMVMVGWCCCDAWQVRRKEKRGKMKMKEKSWERANE